MLQPLLCGGTGRLDTAPMDISVWNSMWALAKQDQTGRAATAQETRFDFNLGFALCVLLAVCFMILGTLVVHQNAVTHLQAWEWPTISPYSQRRSVPGPPSAAQPPHDVFHHTHVLDAPRSGCAR